MFEQLLACSWRGIEFPISSMEFSFDQDLAEHKYWGSDGANVEATGRNPLIIKATIPFVNGIVPGKNERWLTLYPNTFREFVTAFTDRTTGLLVHPEFGEIVCKPQSFSTTHEAARRDGVEVQATWIETLDDELRVLQVDSPVQTARQIAKDLDASNADIVALVPEGQFPEESFESLINKATGVVDSVSIAANLLINKPRQVIFRLEQFQNSVDRLRNVNTWPLKDAVERIKEKLLDISDAFSSTHTVVGTGSGSVNAPPPLVSTRRAVARLVTPQGNRMTASQIQASLPVPNSMEELIALNPSLVARPEVAGGTLIRYYA